MGKGAIRLVNTRTPEQWAAVIRTKWQENVDSIFETAMMLETAHEELGPAGFQKMLRDDLQWSKSMASRLMAIAADNKLAEVSHVKLLASWSTLYALTRLTDEQFADGIESGVVHAGMERKDIRALKPAKETKPKSAPNKPALRGQELVEVETMKARSTIVSSMREMTPEEQLDFLALLRFQLDDLEERRKSRASS